MLTEYCSGMLQGRDMFPSKAPICVQLHEPNSHISTFKLMFADHGYGSNVGRNHKLCAVPAASSRGK